MGLLVLVIFLPLGLSLLIAGLRGRSVGDDPHCRRCGFNLRGRDVASTRCSECGTELTHHAIRTGRHERNQGMMWTGLVITVLAAIAIGFGGFIFVRDYNWEPWKPLSWLFEDVEKSSGATYANALTELKRRVAAPDTAKGSIDAIIDRALAHQTDRTHKWDREWADLIADAAGANRLDAAHAQIYLQSAASATLSARPKARRGQHLDMQFELKFDRLANNAVLHGSWSSSPLMIDSAIFQKDSIGQGEDRELASTIGCATGYRLEGKGVASVSNGQHELKSTIDCVIRQTSPFAVGPVTVKLPVTTPLEIFAKDAIVDDFKVDPDQRQAERDAILAARVTHDSKGLAEVRLKTEKLPIALAMTVVLKQGSAEQKVGGLLIGAGGAAHWQAPYAYDKPKFTGDVEIHLRPDQAAADPMRTLGTYWGEEIIIPRVQVDAPYDPPFNRDESVRDAVVKAIQTPKIEREPGWKMLSVNTTYIDSPVKLAFKEILSWNGHEVVVNPYGGFVSPKSNQGWGTTCDDVDPLHQASECDVIFRPNPEWEKSSPDLVPPWGGEVVLHHVPIKTPAK